MTLKGLKITAGTLATIIFIAIIVSLMLTGLASCNSVKKLTHKDITKIDSVVAIKKDSAVVKAVDSVASKKESSEWETETVFEFDTTRTFPVKRRFVEGYGDTYKWTGKPDSAMIMHDNPNALDLREYFNLTTDDKYKWQYPLKSITIKEKGKKQTEETTALHKTDSAGKKSDELASKTKQQEIKDTSVKRTGVPWTLIGSGLLVALAALALWWVFGLPKRTRKDSNV